MAKPPSFNILRQADDRLILATDFAATGRSTATFHDLVERLEIGHTIWEAAPMTYGRERGMTGAQQADRWANDVRESGLPVHAVIGFCGGNVYAAALTERISQWQETPRVLLIEPGYAKPEMLTEHVSGLLRRLTGTFQPDDLAAAQTRLTEVGASTDEPIALAGALADYCTEVVTPALRRAFHGERASAEFVQLVTGYVHWLAGACQLDPREVWKTATALSSNTPGIGLNLLPDDERAATVGKEIAFDVPHLDLMRTAAVAQTVDELLG